MLFKMLIASTAASICAGVIVVLFMVPEMIQML